MGILGVFSISTIFQELNIGNFQSARGRVVYVRNGGVHMHTHVNTRFTNINYFFLLKVLVFCQLYQLYLTNLFDNIHEHI